MKGNRLTHPELETSEQNSPVFKQVDGVVLPQSKNNINKLNNRTFAVDNFFCHLLSMKKIVISL